jgi:hypothetical protein
MRSSSSRRTQPPWIADHDGRCIPPEDGQSARAADWGQGTRLLPEQAEVRSTPEFISYRYLTIAAAYHRGAGWSRSMVSAALPGGLPEQKMTAPRIAWVLSYTIAAEPGVFAPHDLAPCPTASAQRAIIVH